MSSESKYEFAYIGRCKLCNGVHAAIVDDPADKKEVGKWIANFHLNDLIIERVLSSEATKDFGECPIKPAQPFKQAPLL